MKLELLALLLVVASAQSALAGPARCADIFDRTRTAAPSWIDSQVNRVISYSEKADLNVPLRVDVAIAPTRNALYKSLYENNFVRTDEVGLLLGDKLICAKALEKVLGPKFRQYSPRGRGLVEFLKLNGFVNAQGHIIKSSSVIQAALEKHFPDGVILKPVEDGSSNDARILKDANEIAITLTNARNIVLTEKDVRQQIVGQHSGQVLSGERYLLMDRIKGSLLDKNSGKSSEYRIHVLNGRVLHGATINRWNEYASRDTNTVLMESKAQELLNLMPDGMKRGQAYSFDAVLTAAGDMQLIEINTNRGERATWSGFTVLPSVMKTHVNELEARYGWHFEGVSGQLLRSGLGNGKGYVKQDYLELTYDISNGKRGRDTALPILKGHIETFAKPTLKVIEAAQGVQPSDVQSAQRFMSKYIEMIEPVQSFGDPHWVRFAEWMDSQM